MPTDIIYGPEILISPNTSRPIEKMLSKDIKAPMFWCNLCQCKVQGCSSAFQHLTSKSHKKKAALENSPVNGKENGLKRKADSTEPATVPSPTKKAKEPKTPDSDFKCEYCDFTFSSAETTIQHIKGRKHIKKLSSLLAAEEVEKTIASRVEELSRKLKVKKVEEVCVDVMNY